MQEYPWEALALLYFNVIKKDSIWQMWYSGYEISESTDNLGYMCFATSKDGKNWERSFNIRYKNDENLLTNILYFPDNIQIIEQFISFDYDNEIYRMIGSVKEKGKITTNILESENGISWVNKKILFDNYYDTQFSVIENGDHLNIYQREWFNGLRAVGRSIIDKNYNIIELPKVMLYLMIKTFLIFTIAQLVK